MHLLLPLLFACRSDPRGPGTDDSGLDGGLDPAPETTEFCPTLAGGSLSGQDPTVDLARAYGTWRFFGISADWLAGDLALVDVLEEDGRPGQDRVAALAAGLGDACEVAARVEPLDQASATLLEGGVALLQPGTGALSLPEGASVVAVDLRGLPATGEADAAIDQAVGLALAQPTALGGREVRDFLGFPSQYYYSSTGIYNTGTADLEETLPALGSQDLPLVLLTGGPLSPHAATVAGGLRISGRAALVGQDLLAASAEATWMPVGASGLAFRSSLLTDTTGAEWPDRIPADLSAADPVAALAQVDARFASPGPLVGESTRDDPEKWRADAGKPAPGTLTRGTMRACLIVAWATLDRFFPYFDIVGRGIDDALIAGLDEIEGLASDDRAAMTQTLGHFFHALMDSHGFYGHLDSSAPDGYLVLQMERVGGVPLVRASAHAEILPGDTITEIDGVPASDWFEEAMGRYSAATDGYRFDIAGRELRRVFGSRSLGLRSVDGQQRTVNPSPLSIEDTTLVPWGGTYRPSGWLADLGAPELYFLNLNGTVATSLPDIEAQVIEAHDADGLIVDMRDYPGVNHYPVAQLLRTEDFSSPTYVIPTWTGAGIAGSEESFYELPSDLDAYPGPIVLLVGNKTVSAAENFSQMVYPSPQVTVMGQQTAGSNGNISVMLLPGRFYGMFTAMRVLNVDGSVLHGTGIPLDVEVLPTAAQFRDGEDPELLAAIEELGG